ncbi:T9SS type A sorting domain-containing protein [Phaeocystidibacter marisrubri]|uniref:T9SS type A sorting domain-containing protein n=1 Tax=Phaeocystidibacter marisrubri TaxID=1577780 RepID=A0A6L3ZFV3_9FLAO|nr:T9SS type A sorting domain-containing protein [Phaeocystidibacter marisrubri]KAB2816566.1 T9SS type A sorting domain-containing protein [Phaeocystidibacter marisrubri]
MKRVLFTMLLSGAMAAQTYQPPVSNQYALPGGSSMGPSTHSSNYILGDRSLAAYDDGTDGRVIWQHLTVGGSPTPICAGTVNYNGGYSFLEVGLLYGSAGGGSPYTAFVAYHKAGSGHMVDLYDFDPASCSMNFVTTHVLSSDPNPTRISIDNHKEYALVITWTTSTSLQTAVYEGGVFTPSFIHTINTSFRVPVNVDVAFTHANNYMNPNGWDVVMHYVYTGRYQSNLIEVSALDFWTLRGAGAPTTYTPFYEDMNSINGKNPFPNIDGCDHNEYNWAYAYTEDTRNISVRLRDWSAGVMPTTVVVNDGSMGNNPNNFTTNVIPTLAYNHNFGRINVGWRTYDAGQSYVGLRIASDGSGIASSLDYFQIPNNPSSVSPTATLAYSKMTENTQPWLYVFFSEMNGGMYDFIHKYHNMNNGSNFKTVEPVTCSHDSHVHEAALESIQMFPNPVVNQFNIASEEISADQELNAVITDITGKSVLNTTGTISELNEFFSANAESLQSGSYLLRISSEEIGTEQVIKFQKL